MKTIFLKSKKVNLKLKRMWLCHATIIRGLDILLVTRGENIICQVKKKMSTLEIVWLLDEIEHDIRLHAKTVKAPVFLKSPNYHFTFSSKNSNKKFLFIIIFKIYDQV